MPETVEEHPGTEEQLGVCRSRCRRGEETLDKSDLVTPRGADNDRIISQFQLSKTRL